MKRASYLVGIGILLILSYSCSNNPKHHFDITQYEILEIPLKAQETYEWWLFPVSAVFTHQQTKTQIKIHGIWNGKQQYILRFTPTLPGEWRFQTDSQDTGLDGMKGRLTVSLPSGEQIAQNPNYHGFLKVSDNGRYFEYHDGTPFFLLAATNWAINTSRCGLGSNHDGPFYEYLKDRKSKQFTAILMSFLRGFGDVEDINGYRNEGGYPFSDGDFNQLNPDFLISLDHRMRAIWDHGLVAATNITWFGKLNCYFDIVQAKRISAYLTNRYSAFIGLTSLTGEYQYALNDCGWTNDQIEELGLLTQQYNPFRKPVSIHPSSRTDWPPPHNQQSSIVFHQSNWLDCNWLQTGQSSQRIFNISIRSIENYQLDPVKPVFLSEGYYERSSDADNEYHSRMQPWTAFLNGSAGYGYGAFGIWQFYDPSDAFGEPGKVVNDVVPWRQAINFGGAKQMKYVAAFFNSIPWWKLVPHSQWLMVNGEANPAPTAENLTPPQCAAIPGSVYVVYIPRGNEDNVIQLKNGDKQIYSTSWFDPRTGTEILIGDVAVDEAWRIPERPEPSGEDWVLLLNTIDL
ncbi:MAG: hypothetical protein DHS20C17_30720 [Cyclobacteriaceae bacterium]|nr:MAG: hypothetical protein DHS20C17_30720 [Cyclobacteriaceae bacterium]